MDTITPMDIYRCNAQNFELSFARFQPVPNRALVNASICQTLLCPPAVFGVSVLTKLFRTARPSLRIRARNKSSAQKYNFFIYREKKMNIFCNQMAIFPNLRHRHPAFFPQNFSTSQNLACVICKLRPQVSDLYKQQRERAIHSVGTFRGTSSKKPVRGTCRMVL
jgi:hypothetical protein